MSKRRRSLPGQRSVEAAKPNASQPAALPSLAWTSVVFGLGGYESAARFVLGGVLEQRTPVTIQALDIDKGANIGKLIELIGLQRLRALVERISTPSPDAHVAVMFHPPAGQGFDFYADTRRQDPTARAHVGFTMFETDRIGADWVAACNQMDEVWVPSEFNRQTFASSGVAAEKLQVVPLGLDFERYRPDRVRPLALPDRTGFNFLSVFEWNKRKGYDVLLRAYAEAFTAEDDVALYVRTYGYANAGRRERSEAELRQYFLDLCPDPERAPRLVFLLDRIPDADMPALYAACDAFVLPTRGEGWGIPFMEAMAMGKPTIATRWSAHTTFMTDANSFLIDVDELAEVRSGDTEFPPEYWGHRMAEPSLDHLKQLMRGVVTDQADARKRGARARRDVTSGWTRQYTARRVEDRLRELATRTPKYVPAGASVLWSAPLLDPSGYAEEARNFVVGLDRAGVGVRTNPINWSKRLAQLEPRETAALERLSQAPVASEYVHIQHIFPTAFSPDSNAIASVGRTMYETDRLPTDWAARCNQLDEIWVPSEFNVETFARAGVDPSKLHVVPAAFDADRFRQRVPPLSIQDRRGFNFLSVFDWSLRKGWDVLLRAYLDEFGPDEDVSLTIKTYSSYGHTEQQLNNMLSAYIRDTLGKDARQVPKIICLAGTISDADMVRLYRAADAYVMPTRGEGWGRPFMEAMASGLPTIGTNWSGNTAFMSEANSYLLDYELVDVPPEAVAELPVLAGHRWAEPSLSHLRSLMREVYTDRAAGVAKGVFARAEVLEKYDRPAVARIVADHLERLLGNKVTSLRVAWEGSQFVHHSLAHVNREVSLQLIQSEEVDLTLVPYERDQFDPTSDERLRLLADRVNRPMLAPPAVHVRHQWPPCFDAPASGAWVMIQPWEFGGLPADWVTPMRDQVDELWVPSSWVRECYIRSGVPADKVVVIPNGVDVETLQPDGPKFPLKTDKRFKFLFVGGTIGRKGIDVLLETYLQTFTSADDVCLVIKSSGANSFYRGAVVDEQIRRLSAYPGAAAIELVETDLSDAEMAALYRACDALVHPYRGEGFGMPIAEAMAVALPVLVTGYGACLDFCDASTAYLIPAREVPISSPNGLPAPSVGYWWAEPDRNALAALMRQVVADPESARAIGQSARERILRDFRWESVSQKVLARLHELASRTPRRFLPADTFRHDLTPLHLDGRRRVAFLYQPDWHAPNWEQILLTYGQSFRPTDDVTLVVRLDPAHGITESEAGQRILTALEQGGVNLQDMPDMLLVPDQLDDAGLARLYAAVDWIVPSNTWDAERAERTGARVLGALDAGAWRAATSWTRLSAQAPLAA